MDRVDGRDDPPPDPSRRRIRTAPGRVLAAQCGEIAARIHARRHRRAARRCRCWRGRDRSTQYRALLDAFGEPHPAFELGLRWLDRARAAGRTAARARARRLPQRQLHRRTRRHPRGARLGARAPRRPGRGPRLAVREVVAVRRRRPARRRVRRRSPTCSPRTDARAARRSTRTTLRFWVVLGTLKWGVICVGQAFTHRRTASCARSSSPRSAAASPRWSGTCSTCSTEVGDVTQDRPTAAELVTAVREFLERDVMAATEGRVQFHTRVAVNVLGDRGPGARARARRSPPPNGPAPPRCSATTATPRDARARARGRASVDGALDDRARRRCAPTCGRRCARSSWSRTRATCPTSRRT